MLGVKGHTTGTSVGKDTGLRTGEELLGALPKVDATELIALQRENGRVGSGSKAEKTGTDAFRQTLQVQGVFENTVKEMTEQGLRLPNPHLNNFVWSWRETPGYSQAIGVVARAAGLDPNKIMDCDEQVRHTVEQMRSQLPGATFYQITLKNEGIRLDDPLGRREHQIMGVQMPDGTKYIMDPWSGTGPTKIGGANTQWKAAEQHLGRYPGVDNVYNVDQL